MLCMPLVCMNVVLPIQCACTYLQRAFCGVQHQSMMPPLHVLDAAQQGHVLLGGSQPISSHRLLVGMQVQQTRGLLQQTARQGSLHQASRHRSHLRSGRASEALLHETGGTSACRPQLVLHLMMRTMTDLDSGPRHRSNRSRRLPPQTRPQAQTRSNQRTGAVVVYCSVTQHSHLFIHRSWTLAGKRPQCIP